MSRFWFGFVLGDAFGVTAMAFGVAFYGRKSWFKR